MKPLNVNDLKRGDRVQGFYRGVAFTGVVEHREGGGRLVVVLPENAR